MNQSAKTNKAPKNNLMKTGNKSACYPCPVTQAVAGFVRTVSVVTALAASLGLVTTSDASVTYVDATLANTDIASGGADTLWADGDDGTTGGTVADGSANSDGLWRFRSGFGGNGLWEATGSTAEIEDAVEIVTSVSGLTNGTYNAYVFFVAVGELTTVANQDEFPIRAGLSSNPNNNQIFTQKITTQTPDAIVGTDASTLSFANTFIPGTATDGRTNYAGILAGTFEVTDGTLSVYVDDLPAVNDSEERTWYAGIGYELVPESPEFLLTITPATAPATGFVLDWQSQAGKLYNLRTSTDLTGAVSNWALVEGGIEATPPTNTYPVDPADPRRFYAVEEQVEP